MPGCNPDRLIEEARRGDAHEVLARPEPGELHHALHALQLTGAKQTPCDYSTAEAYAV